MTRSKLFAGALMALILPALVALSTPADAKRKRSSRRAKITGKVNLNTAKVRQLTLLPRIGKSTAKRIVAYRLKQRFGAIRDIMRVKGIGKRTFLKAKRHLTVRGPNTLRKLKRKRRKGTKRRGRTTKRRKGSCRC
jgi:competence ComEA-like helix-hairpin-helix protein